MLAGRVDYPKAKLFVDGTAGLSEAKARAVVDCLLDKAATRTTAQLGPMLARRVAKADPDAAKRKQDKAVADREVACYRDGRRHRHPVPARPARAPGRAGVRPGPRHRHRDQGPRRQQAVGSDPHRRGAGPAAGHPVPGPDGQDPQNTPRRAGRAWN